MKKDRKREEENEEGGKGGGEEKANKKANKKKPKKENNQKREPVVWRRENKRIASQHTKRKSQTRSSCVHHNQFIVADVPVAQNSSLKSPKRLV
jgi:hypothetical protein